jgi:glycosyltransferase involved in cell wall biosynthesis
VLVVSSSAKSGGAERAFASLVENLPAFGWEPLPVLLEDGPLRDWLHTPPVVLDAGRTRQLRRTAATVRELARLARSHDADAIVSSQSKCHVYGGAASALARVPAVWWQHGLPRRTRLELVAASVPAAVVVCVSASVAAAQHRLTPWRRCAVVHPGTPLAARASPGSGARLRAGLGWSDAETIGIVGRLEPWKGQELFLRAVARLAATRPRLRAAVVGGAVLGWEGDYPERLRSCAASLGIADRVHFAGHRDDVREWYDALDVVVHASTAEPFGLVLVEAMAFGRPVVTASSAGATEIVEHERSGLVCDHNPEALAAAVERVLDEPDLAARLASGGVARAAHFSEERSAWRFAQVLDEIATAPRALAVPGEAA